MKKYFFVFIVTILLVSSQVVAFFPHSHYYVLEEALKKQQDNSLYTACKNHKSLCLAGDMLSDVSVYWYYTKFVRYKVTHNPPICSRLIANANTEEETACAVGACAHQYGADFVSHNKMVPSAIKITKIPNVILHPFAEQKVDVYVDSVSKTDFDSLVTAADFQKCKPLFLNAMASDNAYEGEQLDAKFNSFIAELTSDGKTSYDASFQSIFIIPTPVLIGYFGIMLLFVIIVSLLWLKRLRYKDRRTRLNWITFVVLILLIVVMGFLAYQFTQGKAFDTFSKYIARPVSAFVPLGAEESAYVQDAIQKTETLFAQGQIALAGTDASGETSLNAADASIKNVQYIIMFVVGLLIMFILWKNFQEVKPKGMTLGGL